MRSSTDRADRVRALAGDTVLCCWARHFTLTVSLSTQEYKWVPVIRWGNLTKCWGVTCDGLASRSGGVQILLAASCYGNRDKLRPDEPVGSIRLHQNDNLFCTSAFFGSSSLLLFFWLLFLSKQIFRKKNLLYNYIEKVHFLVGDLLFSQTNVFAYDNW